MTLALNRGLGLALLAALAMHSLLFIAVRPRSPALTGRLVPPQTSYLVQAGPEGLV